MWPPGSYTPARVPLPYPPYGTLNFFDQTAKNVLDGIKGHRGIDDRPVADGSRDRRALLGRRQLRGRGVLRQRDHRFRLRDRYHQLLQGPDDRRASRAAVPASSRTSATRPTTCTSTTRASTRRWSTPAATTACSTRRWRTGPTRRPPVVDSRVAARWDHAGLHGEVHEQRGVARSTTRPTARRPTTASTEWKPPRARALPLPAAARRRHEPQVDRHRLQGQRLRRSRRRSSDRSRPPAPPAAPCRRR